MASCHRDTYPKTERLNKKRPALPARLDNSISMAITTSAKTIFTVGHSNRSLPDFLDILVSAEIRILVDVRRFPASRRNPHFNIGPLRDELQAAGISYRHLPELGGHRDALSNQLPDSYDGWPPGSLRHYALYAASPPFQRALDHLEMIATERPAIMCAEKNWTDCHRQIIADYLIVRRRPVVHLIDAAKCEAGALTSFARVEGQNILYPAARTQLRFDI